MHTGTSCSAVRMEGQSSWRGQQPSSGPKSCPRACGGAGSSQPGCESSSCLHKRQHCHGEVRGPGEVRKPGGVVFGEGVLLPAPLLPAESLMSSCSFYSPPDRLVFSPQPPGPSFPFERERLF